jgi:hypothetical protein
VQDQNQAARQHVPTFLNALQPYKGDTNFIYTAYCQFQPFFDFFIWTIYSDVEQAWF